MTENQKLREVLQHAIEDLSSATGFLTGRSRERQSKTVAALAKLQADIIALSTADHLPDAGKMVVDHFPDATKMIETAAPVGEREAFEREMSKPPFEFCMDRWPDDGAYAWPGGYAAYHTQCAWDAWQARAALSAGDAVDAQRWKTSELISRTALTPPKHRTETESIAFNAYRKAMESGQSYAACVDAAIDAAMRKEKP